MASTFTQTASYARPPKSRDAVEIFRDGGPSQPFQAVGTLRIRSGLGYRLGLDKLIAEAAARGCDALYELKTAADYTPSTIGETAEKTREDDFTATCAIYEVPDAGGAVSSTVSPPTESPRPFQAGTPE